MCRDLCREHKQGDHVAAPMAFAASPTGRAAANGLANNGHLRTKTHGSPLPPSVAPGGTDGPVRPVLQANGQAVDATTPSVSPGRAHYFNTPNTTPGRERLHGSPMPANGESGSPLRVPQRRLSQDLTNLRIVNMELKNQVEALTQSLRLSERRERQLQQDINAKAKSLKAASEVLRKKDKEMVELRKTLRAVENLAGKNGRMQPAVEQMNGAASVAQGDAAVAHFPDVSGAAPADTQSPLASEAGGDVSTLLPPRPRVKAPPGFWLGKVVGAYVVPAFVWCVAFLGVFFAFEAARTRL